MYTRPSRTFTKSHDKTKSEVFELAPNTKYTRDITPDPSLLPKSGQVNYSIPDAVGEFVDNEVDARTAGELLSIEIYAGQKQNGTIEVKGNGTGMDADTLSSALKMGYSIKSGDNIGQFGLGLKTAATNLGKRFEIVTVPKGGDRGFKVVYDEEEFLKNQRWEIEIEEVKKPFDHGTKVTVTQPKVSIYGGVDDIIAVAMGRIFRHFLKSEEVEITVNGTPVVPYEWDLEEGSTQTIDIDVNGKKVIGWYGWQTKASNKTGYGFELIRHNRIVRRHEKLGFKPHPKLMWLVGEVRLDDFPVTLNKTDFIRDTGDWRALEVAIGAAIKPVVEMTNRRYQSKLSPRDAVRTADVKEKVEEAMRSEEFARTLDHRMLAEALKGELAPTTVEKRELQTNGKSPTGGGEAEPDAAAATEKPEEPTRPRNPKEVHDVLRRTRTKLLNLNIEHVPVKFGPDALYKWWEQDGLGEHKKLIVSSNLDHPMFGAFDDTVTWIKHNIAESVAEFLAAETLKVSPGNAPVSDVIRIKSDILRYVGELQMAEEFEEVHA
jgi:hypothetical protein